MSSGGNSVDRSSTTVIQFLSKLRLRHIALSPDGDRLTCNGPKEALTVELKNELVARKQEILRFLRSARTVETNVLRAKEIHPDRRQLSPAQQRLWFLEQLEPGSSAYNIALAALISGRIDSAALEGALKEILNRHEVMRSSFVSEGGMPTARIESADGFALRYEALRGMLQFQIKARATAEARAAFTLENGPLFRATLFRITPKAYLLAIVLLPRVGDHLWRSKCRQHLHGGHVSGVLQGVAKLVEQQWKHNFQVTYGKVMPLSDKEN